MIITLSPFYCHEHMEVAVEPSTISLLYGNSGCGKSTIMEAVEFALYGGKCSGGKYKVVLDDQDVGIKITRSTSPAHVVAIVGKKDAPTVEYVDAAAEQEIATLYGTKEHFRMGGYIHQDERNYFFTCSKPEKMRLIESLVHQNMLEISMYDSALKALAKSLSSTANASKVERDAADRFVSMCRTSVRDSNNDIADMLCRSPEQLKEDIKLWKNSVNDARTRVGKLSAHLDTINHTEFTLSQLMRKKDALLERMDKYNIDDMRARLQDLSQSFSSMRVSKYDVQTLDANIRRLRYILRITNDASDADIRSMLSSAVKDYESSTSFHSALSACGCTDVAQYEATCDMLKEKLSTLNARKAELSTLASQLGDRISKNKNKTQIECPLCEGMLLISHEHGGEIKLVTKGDSADDLDIIQELEEEKAKLDAECKQCVDDIRSADIRLHTLQKHHRCLHDADGNPLSFDEPDAYLTRKDDLQGLVEDLNERMKISAIQEESISLVSKEQYDSTKKEMEKAKKAVQEYESLNRDLSFINTELSTTSAQLTGARNAMNELASLGSIEECKESIASKEKLIKDAEDAISIIDSSNKYNDALKKYEETSAVYAMHEKRLSTCTSVQQKHKEARSLYLRNILSIITSIVQEYVDLFFDSDPLIIMLDTINAKKDNACEFVMSIRYKQMDISWNNLSGGEKVRLSLAFTIAINKFMKIPYLLLDESICSIESSLREHILDVLKDYCKNENKIIICASHVEMEGDFDSSISI